MYITPTMCDGVLHCLWFVFNVFWCLCMAINVNVQYNGGFLPDIILFTQCYLHQGTCLNAIVKKGKRGACEQKAATVLPNRTAAA